MATAQSVFLLAVCILLITEFILAKRDYYDILGVPKDATERQIKKAFHKQAMKYHPDRNKSPDAESKFREIAEAYETLSDDKRRREYDQFGHGSSPGGGFGAGGGGGGGAYNFNQHFRPFNFNFDDIFKDFGQFGQQQQQQQQQQQHHHHYHHSQANAQANQKRHFDSHFQAHQEAMSRQKRQFQQGAFGGGLFDDMFEDLEKMFSFGGHASRTGGGRFQGSGRQHCRTVTQRKGNMVSTFTDCS